jgi:midasin
MDLLGSDLPVEGGRAGEFSWCDGVFLQALKAGDWVLLDELNLASQSVLEGLNSCLDHRSTIYIPELDRSFDCPSQFRIFACQNPSSQGGGRKGKYFLKEIDQFVLNFYCRSSKIIFE